MLIIGCDFHPRFQQIAYVDQESGEYGERRLSHPEEATLFYRSLSGRPLRIGFGATANYRWSRCLLAELGHAMLLGDPGAIHASIARKQQTDKRDARHILTLVVEDRLPAACRARREAPVVAAPRSPGAASHPGAEPAGRGGQERRFAYAAWLVREAPPGSGNSAAGGLAGRTAQRSAGPAG